MCTDRAAALCYIGIIKQEASVLQLRSGCEPVVFMSKDVFFTLLRAFPDVMERVESFDEIRIAGCRIEELRGSKKLYVGYKI